MFARIYYEDGSYRQFPIRECHAFPKPENGTRKLELHLPGNRTLEVDLGDVRAVYITSETGHTIDTFIGSKGPRP